MSSQGMGVLTVIGLSVLWCVFGGNSTNDDTYIVYESAYSQEFNEEKEKSIIEDAYISTVDDYLISDDSIQEYPRYESEVIKESSNSSIQSIGHYHHNENEIDQELEKILAEYEKIRMKLKKSSSRISDYKNTDYTSTYANYTPTYTNDYIPRPVENQENNVNSERVYVQGYYRSNGTYVEPYIRTAPNSSIDDNFTYYKNYNPYTGKKGSIYN